MTTDTSERGLEGLICTALTGGPCDAAPAQAGPESEVAAGTGGVGWICGSANDYDREYTVDLGQFLAFLIETQPEAFYGLRLEDDGPARRKFLARLQGEISKRGVIDVLRKGSRTGRITSSFSMARRLQGTPAPPHAMPRTASRSRASSAIAVTRPSVRSTLGSSSTACRSPRSS